jgi:hypothetical protein
LKTHLGRRPFSAMELHTLYHGYIYDDIRIAREQPKHWHFWLPLIAYYSGAYSDEIGCLTLNDIITVKGQRCFDFHTHGKIKHRIVPIHHALIAAGFNEYYDFVHLQKHSRLLFDLPAKSGRYSEKVRIWFSGEGVRTGYMQKCALPNIDQLGMKTAVSSLRLNFEQQIRIYALQLNSKDAFNYLLGFNDYPHNTFEDFEILNSVVQQIRSVNSTISWQRFNARHSL